MVNCMRKFIPGCDFFQRYLTPSKQQKQQNARENAQNHKPTDEVACLNNEK